MCKFDPKNDSRRIDPCMKNLIKYLNEDVNVKTYACCCGHGKYPMTIVVKSVIDKNRFELLSKVDIPRKKQFYKKDKEGYYYIPECVEIRKGEGDGQ